MPHFGASVWPTFPGWAPFLKRANLQELPLAATVSLPVDERVGRSVALETERVAARDFNGLTLSSFATDGEKVAARRRLKPMPPNTRVATSQNSALMKEEDEGCEDLVL